MISKGFNKGSLVAPHVMHVDFVKAEVDKTLDVGAVLIDIAPGSYRQTRGSKVKQDSGKVEIASRL